MGGRKEGRVGERKGDMEGGWVGGRERKRGEEEVRGEESKERLNLKKRLN